MRKPTKPADLLGLSRGVETKCRANQAENKWAVSVSLLKGLTEDNDALAAAIEANADRATKNTATAAAQKAAFDTLNRTFEEFIEYLHANRKVPDEAFYEMGIRPRKRGNHEPIPAPTVAPDLEVITGEHGQIKVIARVTVSGAAENKLTPRKYHGVLLEYYVKNGAAAQQESSTRKARVFRFADEDTGKTFFVRAAWQNPRLQAGPWSGWESALIN